MRRPSIRLIITFLISLAVGYALSWAIMIGLDAPYRLYGFGNLTAVAGLIAVFIIIILDRPLNLRTFDWPSEEEEAEGDKNTRHLFAVSILILVVTAVSIAWLQGITLLPAQASAEAVTIDWLFGWHLRVIAFLFALVVVFMVYSLVVFRRKPGETGDGAFFHGHTGLEIAWTIVPLVVVLYFGYLGARTLGEITAPGPDEMVVEVRGAQWSWRFDYPESGISSTELNLPRGRQILLKLTSIDVIHSFWVPEFRVKQDAVPGLVTDLRVTPTQVGAFTLRCAELCGRDHATMLAPVNVMEPADFEAWVEAQTAPATELTPAEAGEKVAELQGCTACHSVDGTAGVGPTWQGLFGREESLADGSTVTVDEAYLRESIVAPNDDIVAGFAPNLMPSTFGNVLTAEEIDNLIAYIKSLSN
ncbi:MAG: cytochrome c oxidase subunit II [Anaerolineae bacterium]